MKTLFTRSEQNTKTAKDKRFESVILHLAPYKVSGKNTCPMAAVDNTRHALDTLAHGGNVAVVFNVKNAVDLPLEMWSKKVINGDETDLRFLDPTNIIVGLASKGDALKISNGFCWEYCLNTSGRSKFQNVQNSRIEKTKLFHENRDAFILKLSKEIENLQKRARKNGKPCAVRLNGTSDIRWEKVAPSLFTDFPDVAFYDYTKVPNRQTPDNYHLTYSMQFIRKFNGMRA